MVHIKRVNEMNDDENYTDVDFVEYCNKNGLTIIETTDSLTGYPQNLLHAAIGFESFEEAEKALDDVTKLGIDCSLMYIYKKDGWKLWSRGRGNTADNAYDYADHIDDINDRIEGQDFDHYEVTDDKVVFFDENNNELGSDKRWMMDYRDEGNSRYYAIALQCWLPEE